MSRYVKIFKVEEGAKDKNNKLMSFRTDYEIEDLKNIKLNALPVYDDRYIKAKTRTYDDKVYTNIVGLNVLSTFLA